MNFRVVHDIVNIRLNSYNNSQELLLGTSGVLVTVLGVLCMLLCSKIGILTSFYR